MKSIILSVNPQEAVNILNGEQTIIIKKTAPKETPFKVYLYCTKGRSNSRLYKEANTDGYFLDREGWRGGDYEKRYLSGKVVAEFICKNVNLYVPMQENYFIGNSDFFATCLTDEEINNYGKGKDIYGCHITDLKIYDEPRELGEFKVR